MTTTAPINMYWNFIKDLEVPAKLELIKRLTDSLANSFIVPKAKEHTLDKCFGAWATDENEYSTEQLIADIDNVCADKNDFINQFL